MQLNALADIVRQTVTAQVVAPAGPQVFAGEPATRRVPLAEYRQWLTVLEAAFPAREELVERLLLLYYPTRFSNLLRASPARLVLPAGTAQDVRDAWESVLHVGYVEVGPAATAVRITPLWPALSFPRWASTGPLLFWRGMSVSGYVTWQGDLVRILEAWLRRRMRNPTAPADETAANVPADAGEWLRRAVAQTAPREDLRGAVDAVVLSAWAEREPARSLSELLGIYYGLILGPFPPDTPQAAQRLDLLVADDPVFVLSGTNRTEASLRALLSPAAVHSWATFGITDRSLAPYLEVSPGVPAPWFAAATTRLVDLVVAALLHAGADQLTLPSWPAQPDPLYDGRNLQSGDDDATQGGQVSRLVADLCGAETAVPPGVGFDGRRDDPDTVFGSQLALLVREFQIEASQPWIWARTTGGAWVREPAFRRYRGPIDGRLGWETRRTLQLWLNRPDFTVPNSTDALPELQAQRGLAQIANGLQVFLASPADHTANVHDSLWWWDDSIDAAPRAYVRDRLRRTSIPPPEVLRMDPEVVAVGGWVSNPFGVPPGGPVLQPGRGTWGSARLAIARLERLGEFPAVGDPARAAAESTFAVVYAMSNPEIRGFLDVYNGWDIARLSCGPCHWTLRLSQNPVVRGELAGLLARYRGEFPRSFAADFGRWGVEVDPFAALAVEAPGKAVGSVKVWGVPGGPPGPAPIPGTQTNLMDWFRSWRAIFRLLAVLRTSDDFLRSGWRLSRWRIREALNARWHPAAPGNAAITGAAGGPARFGEILTSEATVAAFMRWHINKPVWLFPSVVQADDPGTDTAQDAVRDAVAAAGLALPVTAAALGGDNNVASLLLDEICAPARDAQQTVAARAAVNAAIPDLGNRAVDGDAGSFRFWAVGV